MLGEKRQMNGMLVKYFLWREKTRMKVKQLKDFVAQNVPRQIKLIKRTSIGNE